MPTTDSATLKHRAQALQLHGVLSHWDTCCTEPWVGTLLDWEEQERSRRSMERRLHSARIGRFKPLVDYDWSWPEQIDQASVSELMTLQFLHSASNAILVAPSGVGKTTIAQNIAHQAVLQGHSVMFTTPKLWASRATRTATRRRKNTPGHAWQSASLPRRPHETVGPPFRTAPWAAIRGGRHLDSGAGLGGDGLA